MFKSKKISQKSQSGFTLLEILLVVAAIGILAGIVILAINPARQLAQTRNAQRQADVNTILNATYQFTIDNNGNLPSTITTTEREICLSSNGSGSYAGTASSTCSATLIELTSLVLNEKYLTRIPSDPSGATTTSGTGYAIFKSANGRITVHAWGAENNASIQVTR